MKKNTPRLSANEIVSVHNIEAMGIRALVTLFPEQDNFQFNAQWFTCLELQIPFPSNLSATNEFRSIVWEHQMWDNGRVLVFRLVNQQDLLAAWLLKTMFEEGIQNLRNYTAGWLDNESSGVILESMGAIHQIYERFASENNIDSAPESISEAEIVTMTCLYWLLRHPEFHRFLDAHMRIFQEQNQDSNNFLYSFILHLVSDVYYVLYFFSVYNTPELRSKNKQQLLARLEELRRYMTSISWYSPAIINAKKWCIQEVLDNE